MSVEKQSEDRGEFFVALVYHFVFQVYCFSIDFLNAVGKQRQIKATE